MLIDIGDEIYIAFNIKFVSINNANTKKQQILTIGNGNNQHLPNIAINNDSLQLDKNIDIIDSSIITIDKWYNIIIYKTEISLLCWLNKQSIYKNYSYPSHELQKNTNISIYNTNHNIIVNNISIWTTYTS